MPLCTEPSLSPPDDEFTPDDLAEMLAAGECPWKELQRAADLLWAAAEHERYCAFDPVQWLAEEFFDDYQSWCHEQAQAKEETDE